MWFQFCPLYLSACFRFSTIGIYYFYNLNIKIILNVLYFVVVLLLLLLFNACRGEREQVHVFSARK